MSMIQGFDATTVAPQESPQPIPAGTYTAVIIETEEKATKLGDGKYLSLTFRIVGGPHDGRQVWARLNLENRNPTAVNIARAQLSSICRAVNVLRPSHPSELCQKALSIKVALKPNKETGEMTNEIKGFSPAGGAQSPGQSGGGQPTQAQYTPPSQQQQQQQQFASPAANQSTPPWKR